MVNTVFYDIETSYLLARVWRPGEQVIRHNQLVGPKKYTDIICLCYAVNDAPVVSLDWGLEEQNSKHIIEEFDKIIQNADIVIGKNSDRFDNKHLNTLRYIHGLEGMPDWTKYTDDLEKQIRKYFSMSSNSLDFISELAGLGGKNKMEFEDWVKIIELKDPKSLAKMIKYCKKDVSDTRALWKKMSPHFRPRIAAPAMAQRGTVCCRHCGSSNLTKRGTDMIKLKQIGYVKYQTFQCHDCNRFAGSFPIKFDKKGNQIGYGNIS